MSRRDVDTYGMLAGVLSVEGILISSSGKTIGVDQATTAPETHEVTAASTAPLAAGVPVTGATDPVPPQGSVVPSAEGSGSASRGPSAENLDDEAGGGDS